MGFFMLQSWNLLIIFVIPSTFASSQNHYQGNLYAILKLNLFRILTKLLFNFVFITKGKFVFITKVMLNISIP